MIVHSHLSRRWGERDRNYSFCGGRFNNSRFRFAENTNFGLKLGMDHFNGAHRLIKPDWEHIKLADIRKNCYKIHPIVAGRPKKEVEEWRNQREITIKGEDIPSPCLTFEECRLPSPIMEMFKEHGFTRPTAIQAQGMYISIFKHVLL